MSVENLITEHIDIWTSAVKTKSTSGRGSSKKLELYGVKKLRELILELAVRGKLVPQDPNDEPTSLLLERIAAEKAQLVKERKITKPKKLAEVCDDEFSFELPSNWDIRRLPEVYYTISPSGKKLKSSDVLEDGTYPVIDQGQEAIAGYSNDEERVIDIESPIIIFGDHTRNIKYVDFSFVPGADGTKILCPIGIASEFFYLQLRSYDIESRGYGRHFKILNENLFVVPPLKEQHRIVAKVDELMALCDQLEQQTEASIEAHQVLVTTLLETLTNSADADELMQNWARISEHFDILFTTEASIDQLKQTILQLAVMGKLVPQDPSDEPAAELLKRIAEEKAQLVKEKKIKKEKALPPIAEDEKPFELPNGWEWCRLGQIGYDLGGGTPSKSNSKYWDGEIPWVSPKDMKVDFIESAIDTVTEKAIKETTIKLIPKNSLLMVVRGMILAHSFPVALTNKDVVINQDMKALVFSNIDPHYLLTVMKATKTTFTNLVDRSSHGTCKLISEKLWNVTLAIPPLNEQKKINMMLEQIMDICEQLKQGIRKKYQSQLHLTNTIVEQAV
ncbi:restriction endonuclease subunit S [Vibrio vulnificus]|nr:restriction endonuclease subunit S [Vibrio vulnificus]